jgi:hypothetical protein
MLPLRDQKTRAKTTPSSLRTIDEQDRRQTMAAAPAHTSTQAGITHRGVMQPASRPQQSPRR